MAQNQARHTRRITEAQTDALLKAVVNQGLTVAEARVRAKEGRLGVPAFTIGHNAYSIVRTHRARYEAADPAARDLAIDAEIQRIVALALTNSRKLTADSTPEERARVATELARVKKAARDAGQRTTEKTSAPEKTEPEKPQAPTESTVADLLALAPKTSREGARTGSLGDARSSSAPAV